jgi:hypothetical protein
MYEQLTLLAQQFGNDAIVNNTAVPDEHNDAVINEASSSILSGLQNIAESKGGADILASLFHGNNTQDSNNPAVHKITQQLTGSLGEKFGLNSKAASAIATSMIPQILESLFRKARDSKDSSLQISELLNAITNNGTSEQNSKITDAISKYGTQFVLDQNTDGKIDLKDATQAISKNSNFLSGLFGKFFK